MSTGIISHDESQVVVSLDHTELARVIASKEKQQALQSIALFFQSCLQHRLSVIVIKKTVIEAAINLAQEVHHRQGRVLDALSCESGLLALLGKQTIEEIQEWFEAFCLSMMKLFEKRGSKWIVLLEQYLEKNFTEEITLKSLGEQFYVNPVYLGQLVKKEKGVTLAQWLNGLRILNAKDRLLHTDEQVAAIAEQVGYKDLTYFYKQFRRIEGRSPNQVRTFDRR